MKRRAFQKLRAVVAFCIMCIEFPALILVGPAHAQPSGVIPTAPLPITATPNPSDPYRGLRIAELSARRYGGGTLTIQKTTQQTARYTRYLISYPSDGIPIAGFMNVPSGTSGGAAPPYPVIIALHGYIDPAFYTTLDYTTGYADRLAEAGYLVIHPNLRGYRPSGDGPNTFRVGFAVDVLNLIALVKAQGGLPGPLQAVDPTRIGLWGHSMGGGVSIRVLTISRDIRASVLYGAMSGDEARNYAQIRVLSNGTRGSYERSVPPEALQEISAGFFLDRITAAVSIHHGTADTQVPPVWSTELCKSLQALGKTAECFSYPGQPHTFIGAGNTLFISRMIAFYDQHLR
jgi:dipeptidyl aminopeptidase/acylaminoacyl peptidase